MRQEHPVDKGASPQSVTDTIRIGHTRPLPTRKSPTTASKLVVLGTLHGSDVGEQVKRLWHGLSRACHHHAYELQPSAGEIQALIAQVRALTEMQDRST